MSKTTEKAPVKNNGATAEVKGNEVATATTPVISAKDAAEKLKSAKVGKEDSGYLNFKAGDEVRVLFTGWKEIPASGKPGETVNAAVFITEDEKEQINADSVIRTYFERQTIGVSRKIVCTGVNKSDKGEYKTFKFYELEH